MPRRNILIIFFTAIVAMFCYQRVDHNPYGRYLAFALAEIDENALEQIPPQVLFEGAMNGMVSKLNEHIDENSSFISQKEAEEFKNALIQEFGGVGVTISFRPSEEDPDGPNHLMVINPPWPDTPAIRAGIRAQDEIIAIDGEPVSKMTMTDIMHSMRGIVGTPVELTVLHEGSDKPEVLKIIRDVIVVPSVMGDKPLANGDWDFRLQSDPRLGYVRLSTFGEKTYRELQSALSTLRDEQIQGLIIDLRDNTGGRLDAAVEICQLFLPQGADIVSIRGRNAKDNQFYRATRTGPYTNWPLAVLVNGDSASASEIVAACLQDNGRAVVIGTRSYGKGTVQHLISMEAQRSLLKLTVAKYLRPSGENIHRAPDSTEEDVWGVLPNPGMDVPLTKEERERMYRDRARRDLVNTPPAIPEGAPPDPDEQGPADPQLQKAIDELLLRIKQEPGVARAA